MQCGFVSRAAAEVPRSGIRDVFDDSARFSDVISFAVGEPFDSVPEYAARAGIAAIERGDTHYTNVLGIPEFRQAVADYTRRAKGLVYDPEHEVQAVPGATLGLYLALLALIDPGDEVLIPSPHFASYDAQVQLCGGRAVYVALRPENGMRLNAHDIERSITARTKAIIVNSPGNPTGAVTSASELEKIGALCAEHDIWAISDEVYHAFAYGLRSHRAAPSIASVQGMRQRTIVVDSLSKTYAMTGWRIGYMLAPHEVIVETSKIAELINSSNNAPAQYAGTAALDALDSHIVAMRAAYAAKRQLVIDAMERGTVLRMAQPEGAFYAFVDVRGTGLSSQQFSRALLTEEHVAVVPGTAFGATGEGFIRVSYAGAPEQISEGMDRMVRFAEQLG